MFPQAAKQCIIEQGSCHSTCTSTSRTRDNTVEVKKEIITFIADRRVIQFFITPVLVIKKKKIQTDSTNSAYACHFGSLTIPETSQASRWCSQSDRLSPQADGSYLRQGAPGLTAHLQSNQSCPRAKHLCPLLDRQSSRSRHKRATPSASISRSCGLPRGRYNDHISAQHQPLALQCHLHDVPDPSPNTRPCALARISQRILD